MGATVKVKCFNGKVFDLDFLESDTVPELQQKIAKESGIETGRQTLLFKGKLLEGDGTLSAFSVTDGSTINVAVRRGVRSKQSSIGKPAKEIGGKESSRKRSEVEARKESGKKADDASTSRKEAAKKEDDDESGSKTALENMMRRMNMNAGTEPGPGLGGLGGIGGPGGAPAMGGAAWMEQMAKSMGAPGAAGGKKFMDNFMSVMPQMMESLWNSPEMKEYLEDPAKQEASRQAIMKNLEEAPFMKDVLEEDPEFKRILEDPLKWKESMTAARTLFQAQTSPSVGQNGSLGGRSGSTEARSSQASKDAPSSSKEAIKVPKRQTAADVAPPTINIARLSESYGHALGQSLINSGLGLDPDLVIAGLRNACKGKDFPMQLSTYEKQMSQLQQVAAEFTSKANLEDANNFFEETERDPGVKTINKGKVMYQPGELAPEPDKAHATKDSTVLVILQGRLLDDRYFFTCPAADESGDTVHPLTLPLASAPPALRDGIVGMRETEERTLFVHPSATEGMQEMFGELLPPNALLIFDLELVSAEAPPEEVAASKAAAAAAGPAVSSVKA